MPLSVTTSKSCIIFQHEISSHLCFRYKDYSQSTKVAFLYNILPGMFCSIRHSKMKTELIKVEYLLFLKIQFPYFLSSDLKCFVHLSGIGQFNL